MMKNENECIRDGGIGLNKDQEDIITLIQMYLEDTVLSWDAGHDPTRLAEDALARDVINMMDNIKDGMYDSQLKQLSKREDIEPFDW